MSEGHWCMMGPNRSQTGAALPGRPGCTVRGEGLGGSAPPVFTVGCGKEEHGREVGVGEGLPGCAEGQVPSLRVCLASLACPVLPEGRNRNDEKRTRLRAPRPRPVRMPLRTAGLGAGDTLHSGSHRGPLSSVNSHRVQGRDHSEGKAPREQPPQEPSPVGMGCRELLKISCQRVWNSVLG